MTKEEQVEKERKEEEWNTGTDQKRDSGSVHGILF